MPDDPEAADEPPVLIDLPEIDVLDEEHTTVILTLKTNKGTLEVLLGRAAAADMIAALADFLGGPYEVADVEAEVFEAMIEAEGTTKQ